MTWSRYMRKRENVVEALVLISWDYYFKPAIFWWTYPFLRALLPWWRREWEKYRSATLRERQFSEDAARVDLHSAVFVDRSTDGFVHDGEKVYPEGRPDLWMRPGKLRVKVRRFPPITEGSMFRYVRYTFDDGRVKWAIERTPEQPVRVGWVTEKPGVERAYIVEED